MRKDRNISLGTPNLSCIGVFVLLSILHMGVMVVPGDAQERVETEVVTLKSHGFEPALIQRAPGKFKMIVLDSVRMPALTLVLEDEMKAPLKQRVMGRRASRKWNDVYALPPGTYTVRVKEVPTATFKIVIR